MITFLTKLFIKDADNVTSPEVRGKYGSLCGALGIFLNVILFFGKLFAGILTGSVAIVADAANNLTDAGSSVVTLIGFKLSTQKPDRSHPFGHGRIEYITGFIISVIIMIVGFELGKSSVEKIIAPETVEFSVISVIILAVSVLVKLYMMLYNRKIGKKIDSTALHAVASDSLNDCIATSVVLISTVIAGLYRINIDGWCGALVALFIMYSGFMAARDTLSPLLGQRPDSEFVKRIEELVLSYDEVEGIHDLVVHNYGPGRVMITLHAEVSASADICHVHDAIDNIEQHLISELGCDAVIHMDPIAVDDAKTAELKHKVSELVKALDSSITIHDFRMVVGPTHTNIIFDIVVPYNFRLSDEDIKAETARLVKILDDNYNVVLKIDKMMV